MSANGKANRQHVKDIHVRARLSASQLVRTGLVLVIALPMPHCNSDSEQDQIDLIVAWVNAGAPR